MRSAPGRYHVLGWFVDTTKLDAEETTLETCVSAGAEDNGHTVERWLTVRFVRLVENVPLEVLLLLHGGVELWVVVLEQKHT